jgi:hypothetical protein
MIDTARALSSASPTLPIDADSPCSVRDSVNLTDVNSDCLPASK